MKHPKSRIIIKLRFKKCIHKNTSFRQFYIICYSCESIEFCVCFLANTLNMNIKFEVFININNKFEELQRFFVVSSSAHALKSPRSKMFSYWVVNVPNVLLIISGWFWILFLRGLYEQLISHFFMKNKFDKKAFSSGKIMA